MHRTIQVISKRVVQIRAGEGRKVGLTFLYFFLIITAYYVIKPVSRSLALGDLGSRLLPFGDLISAILMGPMVALFAYLVDRVDKRRLVTGAFWTAAGSLIVFWKLLSWPNKWLAAAFYVWVAIFSVLAVTLFWLVANDLFHPREAKRLFGFIGSGGMLGGVVGSQMARFGAKIIGTEQLLLVSSLILLGSWLVVESLWGLAVVSSGTPKREPAAEKGAHEPPKLSNLASMMRTLRESRYLLLLVGLVGVAKFLSTLIDYQFNPFLEQHFLDLDARTAFIGQYNTWINVAAFFVQFFFTSWVLRRLGLLTALLALPIGLLGGFMGLLAAPGFWMAGSLELYDRAMNYSLQQTSKEVLYLPIDRSVRYKLKPFIDMVVFRFGKGLAAVVGIVALSVFHAKPQVLTWVCVPLAVGWIFLAVQLRYDYISAIRTMLQSAAPWRHRREDDPLPAAAPLSEAGHVQAWLESLSPRHPGREKLRLARELFDGTPNTSEEAKQLLGILDCYERQPEMPKTIELSAVQRQRLMEILSDRHEAMAARRQAMLQLVRHPSQDTVDGFLGMLLVEDDPAIRHEIIHGLANVRVNCSRGLEFPKKLIRRQIRKEVATYQQIAQLVAIYRWVDAGQVVGTAGSTGSNGSHGSAGSNGTARPEAAAGSNRSDASAQLLRLLLEESTQQIFQLLGLLYRPEDIYLIHHQLRQPDIHLRADAIELLDNLIDPGLRWVIFPVLDENRFMERVDGAPTGDSADEPVTDAKEAYRLLRASALDHNRWLSITVVAVAGRLGLDPLLGELARNAEWQPLMLNLAMRVVRQQHEQAAT